MQSANNILSNNLAILIAHNFVCTVPRAHSLSIITLHSTLHCVLLIHFRIQWRAIYTRAYYVWLFLRLFMVLQICVHEYNRETGLCQCQTCWNVDASDTSFHWPEVDYFFLFSFLILISTDIFRRWKWFIHWVGLFGTFFN